jgi:hypothetical protein
MILPTAIYIFFVTRSAKNITVITLPVSLTVLRFLISSWRHAVAPLVETLRYKLEGRGFDSQWCHPSGCTVALGLTQTLTEMSSRNISWGVKAAGA